MEYIKVNIDEMNQKMVFFDYREYEPGNKGKLVSRAFPFEKLAEKVPRVEQEVVGDIIGIYFEQRGDETNRHSEQQFSDHCEPLEEEVIDWCIELCKKACVELAYDEILKPPSIDEQVEDFIKEFFEEGESEPFEEKDFLSDFFTELEDDEIKEAGKSNLKVPVIETLEDKIENTFKTKQLESVDFLAEFFSQLDEENKE